MRVWRGSGFNGESPIGKHLKFWKESWEIVGVVGGARYWGLNGNPVPHMYFSYHQVNWGSMSVVMRTQLSDPMKLAGTFARGAYCNR
jgi:hypothetical protein